eukprot:4122022-Pyramimonas_sp.AAC.1
MTLVVPVDLIDHRAVVGVNPLLVGWLGALPALPIGSAAVGRGPLCAPGGDDPFGLPFLPLDLPRPLVPLLPDQPRPCEPPADAAAEPELPLTIATAG